jgi:CBS domain containing-hemolysin-like protein
MTIEEIEQIFKETTFAGFPIVLSKESQQLIGYIQRRDLKMAFGNLFVYTVVLFKIDS